METVVDDLLNITREQSDNINKLTGVVAQLAEDVQERPTKKSLYKVLSWTGAIMLVIVLMLSSASYLDTHKTLDVIEDCTNPTEDCAQNNAELARINRGQVVCNQEKVLFFVYETYEPLKPCYTIINSEITRLSAEVVGSRELLVIPEDVPQIPPLKEDFAPNKDEGSSE